MPTFFDDKTMHIDEAQLANALKPLLDPFAPKGLTGQPKIAWVNKVMSHSSIQSILKGGVTKAEQTISYYVGLDTNAKSKMDAEVHAAPEAIKKKYQEEWTKKNAPELKAKLNAASTAAITAFKAAAKSIKV